jgi:hypothetical protein
MIASAVMVSGLVQEVTPIIEMAEAASEIKRFLLLLALPVRETCLHILT